MFVGGRRKPVARKGRKKFIVDRLDLNGDPDKNSEDTIETQRKQRTVKERSKPKRQRFPRTQFMVRTLNNWSECKSMLPEEIIINKNYTHE